MIERECWAEDHDGYNFLVRLEGQTLCGDIKDDLLPLIRALCAVAEERRVITRGSFLDELGNGWRDGWWIQNEEQPLTLEVIDEVMEIVERGSEGHD